MHGNETTSQRQQAETVREVCAEIEKDTIGLLGFESKPWNQLVFPFSMMATAMEMLADRILEAYEREMAAKDAEIARLKAALKPVIEHDTRQYGHQRQQPSIVIAVREAQRVMKEFTNGKIHN